MVNEIEKKSPNTLSPSESWRKRVDSLLSYWPFGPNLFDWGDDWFDNLTKEKWDFVPASDVRETEEGTEVLVEIPGALKENIDVSVKNNILIVSGEKKSKIEKNEENCKISEISYGSFRREYVLDENSNADKVDASFSKDGDGVLRIWVPKKQNILPKNDVKKIEVK